MRGAGGRLIGKEGADGVYCAATRDSGFGFAFKVEDGNSRALGPALLSALEQRGALPPADLARLGGLKRPPVVNHRGETVGFVEACFTLERRS